MANISEYLKKILSARYGKDVRQSIHDSIYAINTQVTESEESAIKSAQAAKASEIATAQSATDAEASKEAAAQSATDAEASKEAAAQSVTDAEESKEAAVQSAIDAEASKEAAAQSVTDAEESKTAAAQSATDAEESKTAAAQSATDAEASKVAADQSATDAEASKVAAATSETNAGDYATTAKSYAVGGTGTRENEDVDNAKYYKDQVEKISQGINGIVPMGTIVFADLPTTNIVKNAMYNISDAFTSDERFNDGGGFYYGPGNNVIWTAENKWDVTASSSVTGVKGENETEYRQGNVNITKENIGLGNVPNVATNDQTPTYTQAAKRANITSGEKLSIILGKIMKFFDDLKSVAFSGSYSDLSNKPSTATTSADGFMSSTDKSKLDGITDGANNVSVSRNLTSGTKVGTITIDDTTYDLYAPTNTDTKNTAGAADSSAKLFLIGATSQSANPQTFSQDTAYVGTDGCLYSGGKKTVTTGEISSSAAITTQGAYALDAREKNASIDGTLANELSKVNSNLIVRGVGYYNMDINSNYTNISSEFKNIGISQNLTFLEVIEILRANYEKFENYTIIYTNSHNSNFSSSLPVQSGCFIEIIGSRYTSRIIARLCDYRTGDIYSWAYIDGSVVDWKKINS